MGSVLPRAGEGRELGEAWVGEGPLFSLPVAGLSPECSFSLTLSFSFPFTVSARPSGQKSYVRMVHPDSRR